MARNVLICKAWPYANGSLHLGHITGLIAADVLARFYRLNGDNVLFVSGTDCHGTPISNRAAKEGKTPAEIVAFYHAQFVDNFLRLGFTHDLYSTTEHPFHYEIARQFMERLFEEALLIPGKVDQLYCESCQRFLVDRFVEGACPNCGHTGAKGDQCESCSATYEATQLVDPHCARCGSKAVIRQSDHLYFDLPALEKELQEWFDEIGPDWRDNARTTTSAWLKRGLEQRAVTRDLDWGIPVPIDGYRDKVIYVWFEAVLGYLSASMWHCGGNLEGGAWEKWWSPENNPLHIYVHGKDNIPFHTIIFPAMLIGFGNLALPTQIISSEYLNLPGGRKFSTSQGEGITIPELLDDLIGKVPGLEVDTIRHFLIANNPETKDSVFSWDEAVEAHNAVLMNQLGNLASRVHALLEKHFENRIPDVFIMNDVLWKQVEDAYQLVGNALKAGSIKHGSAAWLKLIEQINLFISEQKPWQLIKEGRIGQAGNVLASAMQAIANLAILIQPFIPFTAGRLAVEINLPADCQRWQPFYLPICHQLGQRGHLFSRIKREDLPAD